MEDMRNDQKDLNNDYDIREEREEADGDDIDKIPEDECRALFGQFGKPHLEQEPTITPWIEEELVDNEEKEINNLQ